MRPSLHVIFWVSFIAGGIVYAIMLTWTLPSISAAANGLAPFDLRPFGYSQEDANAFLRALTENGRALYLNIQHKLDIAYPALLALTVASGIALLVPTQSRFWKLALASIAVPGSLFDFRENALVRQMLLADPVSVEPELISAASFATFMKSAFSAIALSTLLVLFLLWAYRRWKAAWPS